MADVAVLPMLGSYSGGFVEDVVIDNGGSDSLYGSSKSGEDVEARSSAAELEMQLLDQRDQFLFEYEQLEDEILELRNMVASLQHGVDEANRRWAQERELKLQLERQLMESVQIEQKALSLPAAEVNSSCIAKPSLRIDTTEANQPQTPPNREDYEGRQQAPSQSGSESTEESDSPDSFKSLSASAQPNSHLALALEAQIELADLRQEHRNVVMDLVQAKLEIASLKAGQEIFRRSHVAERNECTLVGLKESVQQDKGHLETVAQQAPEKQSSSRRWFSRSKLL